MSTFRIPPTAGPAHSLPGHPAQATRRSAVLYLDGIHRDTWSALEADEQQVVLAEYTRRRMEYETMMHRAERLHTAIVEASKS